MGLIQSSADILTIVKAFAVLWVAIFFGWFIYYLAMTMRQVFLGLKEMRERIHKVDALIDSLKEKVEHSTSYLLLIAEAAKKLVELAREYGSGKGRKK